MNVHIFSIENVEIEYNTIRYRKEILIKGGKTSQPNV